MKIKYNNYIWHLYTGKKHLNQLQSLNNIRLAYFSVQLSRFKLVSAPSAHAKLSNNFCSMVHLSVRNHYLLNEHMNSNWRLDPFKTSASRGLIFYESFCLICIYCNLFVLIDSRSFNFFSVILFYFPKEVLCVCFQEVSIWVSWWVLYFSISFPDCEV